jgi:hypothetical protein
VPERGGSSKDIRFGLPADRGGWYFIAMNLGVLGMGAGATGLGRDAFCYRSKMGIISERANNVTRVFCSPKSTRYHRPQVQGRSEQ